MAEMPIKLRQVILRSDVTFVETQDKSRFVDADPHKNQGGVDYYILGKTSGGRRLPAEAVLLRSDASTLIRNHAARMSVKIRRKPADAEKGEPAMARLYFAAGKALAEQALSELAAAVTKQQIVNVEVILPPTGLPPNRELTMALKFKNEAGELLEMNVAVKLELYSAAGKFHWRITALTCERNGAKISIVDRNRFNTLEPQLLILFKKMVGGKDGIEAQLKKRFEERRAKQKNRPRHPHW